MNSSLFFYIICFICFGFCWADSDNLQDLCPTDTTKKQTIFINGFPCKSPDSIFASDFKSTKLRDAGDTDNFLRSSVTIVTAADFLGLNTLGLSIARTDLDVDGIVMPHTHPRASEMFFVFKGVVIAGFVDTNGQVFQEMLKAGEVFVFPRGLLHFCFNPGYELATVYSVLNSQNPGLVSISDAVFSDFNMIDKVVRKFISVSALDDKSIRNFTLSRFNNLKIMKHHI